MPEHKHHPEVHKRLTKLREGINAHESMPPDAKKKAIRKLDVVQKHIDTNKVNKTTTEKLLDIITHLGEKSTLVPLIMETIPFLPQ